MGYGLIHVNEKQMRLIKMGVLKLEKLSSHELKLKHIFEGTLNLIDEYQPDELAVEAPFFGKNEPKESTTKVSPPTALIQ